MRLRARVRRRVARARRWLPVLLLAPASVVHAAPQHDEPVDKVRIVYRAPEECPNEAAFLSAVRSRSGSAWEAAPGEPARRIEVTVGVAPTESTARLDFADDDGHHVSRSLTGASCADVVSAIALVTSLAIDSRFTHDESQASSAGGAEPSSTGAPDAAAQAATAPSAVTPPKAPRATAPAPEPHASVNAGAEHRVGRTERRAWKGELGAFGAIASGVGPALAYGGRAIAGLAWPSGADVRIGVDYLVVPETLVDKYGGVNLATYELSGRASGCPLGLSIGDHVLMSPCAGLAAGIVHAETRRSAGVEATGSADPAFVALFAEGRVDARFGAFFVEASGEARFVVKRRSFALAKHTDDPLWTMDDVAAFASLGLGLLL